MIFKLLFIAVIPALTLHVGSAEHGNGSAQKPVQKPTHESAQGLSGQSTGERTLKAMSIDIKVSAAGEVTDVRPDASIPASIRDVLVNAVNVWKFNPAKRNGVPIDWATRVTVSLIAVPINEGFALRVKTVSLASVWADSGGMVLPAYPSSALHQGKDAAVMVIGMPNFDGKPTKVLSTYVNGALVSHGDPFAKASRTAMGKWKFEALQWDGVRYVEPVCVSVEFIASATQTSASQTQESRCTSVLTAENNDFVPIYLKNNPEGSTL